MTKQKITLCFMIGMLSSSQVILSVGEKEYNNFSLKNFSTGLLLYLSTKIVESFKQLNKEDDEKNSWPTFKPELPGYFDDNMEKKDLENDLNDFIEQERSE